MATIEKIRAWRIKTFQRWINARFFETYGPTARFVKNLATEMCDGAFLVNIAVALWKLPNPAFKKEKTLDGMVNGVRTAFRCLKEAGVNTEWFNPVEIAQGNVDATLNLVWLIIMHSDLKRHLPEKPTESGLAAMTQNCAAQLVAWLQRRLADYRNVVVGDSLSGSFRDGLALAALTHFMRIDSLPYSQLSAHNVQQNLSLGISKALQFCNIPGLMDVDDFIVAGGPDEAALMTYLAEFLKYYRKKWGRPGFMPKHNRYALASPSEAGGTGGAGAALSGPGAVKHRAALWEIKYKDLRIEKEIGRGAFGQVFLGSWRMQPVAIKQLLIRQDKMTEEEYAEFMGECELMMALRPHKNVVLLLGVCCDPEQPLCLVTDFQAGGSLHTLLKSDREIGWDTTLRVLEGVAAGMYHIHEEKILHRDLAARNVLLSASMEAMVADFGLSAKTAHGETQETVFRGALKYMAPESLRHNMFSTKSDVWSYGVLVWEVLTRAAPFAELPLQEAAQKIKKGLRLPVPTDCPSPLALILEQCWCQEPESRPSFDQFVAHFATIRREMARYPPLPLLLPGEQARKARSNSNISAAATSLPSAKEPSARDSPGVARRSLDSGALRHDRDAAVAAVGSRRAAHDPRRNNSDLIGSDPHRTRLVDTGHDVGAAAAAAAANYGAMGQAPAVLPSPNTSAADMSGLVARSGSAGARAREQAVPDAAGYGPTAGRAPANEYGLGPSERDAGDSASESDSDDTAAAAAARRQSAGGINSNSSGSVRSAPGSGRRLLSPRVPPQIDSVVLAGKPTPTRAESPSDSAEHSESDGDMSADNDRPAPPEEDGNQYDALPTELDSKRRATIQSALAVEQASVLVGVTSATMQLPPRPANKQPLIGQQRSANKSGAATISSLPSLATVLSTEAASKKPAARAPEPPSLPSNEYGLAPPPAAAGDDDDNKKTKKKSSKKSKETVDLARLREQEAEERGYGLAPPPASASEGEYGLPPPEREDFEDGGAAADKAKKKKKDSSTAEKKSKKKS